MSLDSLLKSTYSTPLDVGTILRLSTFSPGEGEHVSVLKIVKALDLADFGRCLFRALPKEKEGYYNGEWQVYDLEEYLLYYLLKMGYAEWFPMTHVALGDSGDIPKADALAISAPYNVERWMERRSTSLLQLEFQFPTIEP